MWIACGIAGLQLGKIEQTLCMRNWEELCKEFGLPTAKLKDAMKKTQAWCSGSMVLQACLNRSFLMEFVQGRVKFGMADSYPSEIGNGLPDIDFYFGGRNANRYVSGNAMEKFLGDSGFQLEHLPLYPDPNISRNKYDNYGNIKGICSYEKEIIIGSLEVKLRIQCIYLEDDTSTLSAVKDFDLSFLMNYTDGQSLVMLHPTHVASGVGDFNQERLRRLKREWYTDMGDYEMNDQHLMRLQHSRLGIYLRRVQKYKIRNMHIKGPKPPDQWNSTLDPPSWHTDSSTVSAYKAGVSFKLVPRQWLDVLVNFQYLVTSRTFTKALQHFLTAYEEVRVRYEMNTITYLYEFLEGELVFKVLITKIGTTSPELHPQQLIDNISRMLMIELNKHPVKEIDVPFQIRNRLRRYYHKWMPYLSMTCNF
jgi:hypothetical protein